jgi:1,4-dihydroxy-2-naphthoate octaprenyltransferase
MRDIQSDANSGKITLAVKLGLKKSKSYHNLLILGAMLLSIVFSILYLEPGKKILEKPNSFLYLLSFIPFVIHLKKINKAKGPSDFDSQLKVLALSTFLFSILLGVGYILY